MIETKFKNTDIGQIPEDWDVQPLKNLISSANYGVGAEAISYDGMNKYIRITDIDDNSHRYVPSPLCSPSFWGEKYKVFENDILIARTGASVGKSYIYNKEDGNLIFAGFLIKIGVTKANSKYVFYNTLTARYNHWLTQESARSGQPGINVQQIKEYLLPIPKASEQSRISSTLSTIDNLISELEKLIEKKRAIKQGAMQQLLTGKRQLKGFSEPWVEKTIREIGDLTGAGVDKKIRKGEQSVRLVNYLDVFHRDFIYNRELDFWTTANESKTLQCNVLKGDVFFTPSSEMPYDIALSAVAMEDMENVCYSYHIYRLRFKEDVDLKYKAYMFKTQAFYDQANTTCEGSGKRYVISLSKFREMKVRYPSDIKEQSAIASILSTMDDEIANLETKRDKYIAIKQGMMQQLLTGKIRLI